MKKYKYSRKFVVSISILLLMIGSAFAVMADDSTVVTNKNDVIVGHSEEYIVKDVGQLRATVDEEGYYSAPRARTTTTDNQDDDVFAGWYQDSACQSPLKADELQTLIDNEDKQDEIIYAKFVSREILDVKAQLQNTVDSTSSNAILRVITTVDSGNYQKVGFNIKFNENTYTKDSDTVSKKLSVVGNTGEESKISPTEFHDGSLYFMAVNLTKIQAENFEKGAMAVPYWVTLDGTKVENSNVETKSVFQGMPTVCEARVTDASGDKDEYYLTLEKAFYVLESTNHYLDEGDTVTVIQDDVEIENRLNVYKNVTLTNEANRDVVITRSYNNSQFMYYNDSALTIEGTVPAGEGKGSLTFDGEEVSSTYGCIESRKEASNLTLKNVSIKNILVNRQGSAVYAHGTATITGCTFENNIVNECSDFYSGAIYYKGSGKTLSVDECEFISNNTTSGNGGAIYVHLADEATISNTKFNSNSAANGGALYVWRAVTNVSGCTFTSNASTEANGGAIYHGENTEYDTKTLTLTDCTFDANNAATTGNGGAVYMNYGPAIVRGSTFTNNGTSGTDLGGAIYVNNGTTTISGSEFSSNKATSKGGAVYDNLGTVTIESDCSFKENSAASGGALYVYQGATGISNSIFTSNESTGEHGGAIFFGGDTENLKDLTLTSCTFDSNKTVSTGYGGAVYMNCGTATVSGGTFEKNGTDGADLGGAIYVNVGTTTISGVEFSSNKATTGGGAVYNNTGTVMVNNECTFSGNSAVNGGALYDSTGTTEVSNSTFTSNVSSGASTADGGGAIYYKGANGVALKLTGCTFVSNYAANRAGAVYVFTRGAEITGSTFTSNGWNATTDETTTKSGGAIFVRTGDVEISDTRFESNKAITSAGAVYAMNHNGTTTTIQETCVFNGNSAKSGGAVYVYQGATGISNSTFTSNSSTEAHGGAIYYGEDTENSTTLTLTGCTFSTNNVASEGNGGAVYVNSGAAGISGSTFTSNGTTGAEYGGAIYINGAATTISDSDFSSNKATEQGGALYDNQGSLTIENTCTFLENSAKNAGALYVYQATATISNAEFGSNHTTSYGGAIFYRGDSEGVQLTLADCKFTSNYTAQGDDIRGGAIYIFDGSTELSGSTFTSNGLEATTNGGAIYVRGGKTVISDTDFAQNKVAGTGGALYINMYTAEVEIKDGCTFTGNNAATSGGAIYNYKATLTMDDCTLTSNTSTEANGGAIYIDTATASLNVSASEFSMNQATSNGGAVYANLGTLTVENNCTFSGNSAETGGAVYIYQGTTTGISDSKFEANISNGTSGGAIYFGENAAEGNELTVTSCTFTSNDMASTGNGGAVYVNSGTATISGSTFTSNGTTGVDDGGAIYVNDGTTTISDSTFKSNQATGNGGAVYEMQGSVIIKETCSFLENSAAEGGALYNSNGTTEVINSSFTSNVSNSATANYGGGAIHYRSSAGEKLKLTNCTFTSNEATVSTSSRGGAVYIYTGGAVIERSTFNSNGWHATTDEATEETTEVVTTVNGGAIYVRTGAVEISGTNFESNKGTTSGGAVYALNYKDTELTVSDSTFTSNGLETTLNGGAIYVSDGTTTISGTTFDSNKVATNGGALYNLKGSLIVNKGCIFKSNVSNGTAEADGGGAIYVNESTATLEVSDSTFKSNSTSNTNNTLGGGAICFNAATGTISESDFDSNYGRRGGAIHVYAGSVTIENGCTFSNNTAARGGATYFHSNGAGSITDAVFISNTATYGGAMQCYNKMTIDGCVFDQNVAAQSGAAVYGALDTFTIANATLIEQAETDLNTARLTFVTQATESATTSSVDNIHDADDGHQLSLLTNIDEAEFEAYCARIVSMGFELRSENTMGADTKTVARTYYSTERSYMLHTYWVEYSKEVRTQVAEIDETMLDPLVALETEATTETTEPVCTPLFHQLAAISYDEDLSVWEGGMGYIIRLKDGRFVIIDGGSYTDNDSTNDSENQWNDAYEIAKFLVQNNVREDNKIVIAAWILTHAHSDHVGAFENFVKHTGAYSKYHFTNLQTKGVIPAEDNIVNYSVELQSIMFNACDTDEQMTYCTSETDSLFTNYIESSGTSTINGYDYSYSDYFANTKIYKPLTGQKYRFADTSIEILHTMSDFLPQTIVQEPDRNGGDYNVQSVVSIVDVDCTSDQSDRFFISGDTTKVACDEMSERYGTYMESDYVQVPHHGYNEFTNYIGTELEYKNSRRHAATQEIYQLLLKDDNSTIVMWPTSNARFEAKTLSDTTATEYIAINDWLYRTGQPDTSKHWIAESVSDENRTIEFE